MASSLASRGTALAANGGVIELFKTLLTNPYHPSDNLDGFINLGISENNVMLEEVAAFASKNVSEVQGHHAPRTALIPYVQFSFLAKDVSYGEGPWGSQRLRNAMAKYIDRHFHPVVPIDPECILFANGVTSLCEMLGFSLCNEGDGILFSRPIYQAFGNDFTVKAKVNCVFVSFEGVDQFSLDGVKKHEEALLKAQNEGVKIRALLLCHPHNPLGQCYPKETIIGFMKLCAKYSIHLIADEIYALSVYDVPDPHAVKFESVLSFESAEYIDPKLLHLLYGFSKDMAASGIRLGCIYTRNDELMRAMSAIGMFHWSGSANEQVAIAMLENENWIDGMLQLSRERLSSRNQLTRKLLDEEAIKYHLGANAGFFIWVDLRPFLPVSSSASLEDRWQAEGELAKRMIANKVYITPGKDTFAEEPGWFRFIFSQDEQVIREGLKRIMSAVRRRREVSL